MDIIGNYKNVLTKKYSDFKGRADSTEYLLFVTVNASFSIAYQIFASLRRVSTTARVAISLILGLFYLQIYVHRLPICLLRLHYLAQRADSIVTIFIPVIGAIWFLVLCIKEGEPTANRFGEPQP